MAVGQVMESGNFPDPFWFEHGEQIRAIRKVIEAPKTSVGEEILKDAFNIPFFMVYNRFHPILSSLITLVEYDEIGKAEGKSYFSEPTNQRTVLKALKLLVEDSVKFPYSKEEKKTYEDYRRFFESTLSRLRQLEEQIEAGQKPPNFVNSLAIIISHETGKLEGGSFSIKTEKIREKISGYLPKLAKVDDGEILSEIQAQLEMPLVNAGSTPGV